MEGMLGGNPPSSQDKDGQFEQLDSLKPRYARPFFQYAATSKYDRSSILRVFSYKFVARQAQPLIVVVRTANKT
jgi:hypothetical protein